LQQCKSEDELGVMADAEQAKQAKQKAQK